MLRLEDLRVAQGAFSLRVDLEMPRGEKLAVIGASGSGKSTLLSAVAGFTPVDQGRIKIASHDVTERPVAERPVSILFQDGNLFPHLSAFDNVALGVAPSLKLSAAERDRVATSLDKVGLAQHVAQKPAALSGGQISRVALARMLVLDRPLALFDEPFAALDPGLRREMLALIAKLCAETGLTLMMVTHDLRDAQAICDRVVVLEAGRIVLDTKVREIAGEIPEALAPWA